MGHDLKLPAHFEKKKNQAFGSPKLNPLESEAVHFEIYTYAYSLGVPR